MKSLLSSRPVLLFLFLFNAAVAVAVGVGGHRNDAPLGLSGEVNGHHHNAGHAKQNKLGHNK